MKALFNIWKSVDGTHHINKQNPKNHMQLIDAEKIWMKIQHHFLVKTQSK